MRSRSRTAPGLTDGAVSIVDAEARHGSTVALRAVSLDLEPGSLTAVVGPNGSGKSTLFGLLSGRLKPWSGTVRLGGPVAEVLQSNHVDEQLPMTVEDAVRIGRYANKGLLRPMGREDRRAVDAALDAVGLLPLRRRRINQLSGGQRQRTLVAQGLAQEAPILLLDEPTAALDLGSRKQVLDAMRSRAESGTTVLWATHDLTEAAQAENVIVLACDCLCCAPPVDAFADPTVTALFGRSSTAASEPAMVPHPETTVA